MAQLESFLTLQEATDKYRISTEVLTQLVESGKIRAVRLDGTIAVAEGDVRKQAVEQEKQDQIRDRVAHLKGTSILLSEAARKYGFSTPTLSRWAQAGHLTILKRTSRRVYLDEADVAYARTLADKQGGMQQGKAVFPTT